MIVTEASMTCAVGSRAARTRETLKCPYSRTAGGDARSAGASDVHTNAFRTIDCPAHIMVDATDPPPALAQALEQHGQQHLLASWHNLSTTQRGDLVSTLKVSCVMHLI